MALPRCRISLCAVLGQALLFEGRLKGKGLLHLYRFSQRGLEPLYFMDERWLKQYLSYTLLNSVLVFLFLSILISRSILSRYLIKFLKVGELSVVSILETIC